MDAHDPAAALADGPEPEKGELESLVAAVGAPALIFDATGNIRAINDQAEKMLGLERGFLIGKGVELTNSLYVTKQARQERNHRIFEEGKAWEGDWIKVHWGGQDLPSRVRIVPLNANSCWLEAVKPGDDVLREEQLEWQLMVSLVQLAPVGLLVLDTDNSVLYSNPAFESSFNKGRRVSRGCPLARFFESAEYLRLFAPAARSPARRLTREAGMLKVPDGPAIPVRVSTSELTDEGGQMALRLVSVEDQAEIEGAREDAGLMLEASRHLSEALLFSDPAGVLFFANEAALSLLGVAEDALVGKPVAAIFGDGSLQAARSMDRAGSISVRLQAAKGRPVSRKAKVFPVAGGGGRQVAWGWLLGGRKK